MWTRLAWLACSLGALGLLVSAGLGPRLSAADAIADVLAAEALLNDGLLDDAERRIRRALRRQPGLAAAHHLMGRLRARQGRLREADAAFARASRLLRASNHPAARTGLLVVAVDRARSHDRHATSADAAPPALTDGAGTRRG